MCHEEDLEEEEKVDLKLLDEPVKPQQHKEDFFLNARKPCRTLNPPFKDFISKLFCQIYRRASRLAV